MFSTFQLFHFFLSFFKISFIKQRLNRESYQKSRKTEKIKCKTRIIKTRTKCQKEKKNEKNNNTSKNKKMVRN